ncbi:tryptophan-rich sensory protein [Tessaracoccus terricola]
MDKDLLRRLFVTASAVFCVVGLLFGTGLIGQRVAESAGGALSDEATLVAPDGPAFSIWSVIYLGLVAYVVWQWLPRNAATERERSIGWLAGLSMILNGSWLLVTQVNLIWVSVAVILALALVLGLLVRNLHRHPDDSWPGGLIVDGTHGLHLGWVTAASCANIAAAGAASGWEPRGVLGPVLAMAVIAVAAVLHGVYQVAFGARAAVALAMSWAFAWIAVGRTAGEPQSAAVGVVAAVASVLVLLTCALVWLRHRGTT